jgi:hypothetical protein
MGGLSTLPCPWGAGGTFRRVRMHSTMILLVAVIPPCEGRTDRSARVHKQHIKSSPAERCSIYIPLAAAREGISNAVGHHGASDAALAGRAQAVGVAGGVEVDVGLVDGGQLDAEGEGHGEVDARLADVGAAVLVDLAADHARGREVVGHAVLGAGLVRHARQARGAGAAVAGLLSRGLLWANSGVSEW